ncbi:MAG: hypothetical protein M0R06_06125 [Sphaerochaeta sp.]|nr:hypothetical protein [Sphaerochaeta sp.]
MSKGLKRYLSLLLGIGGAIWALVFIGQHMTPDAFMMANLVISAWNVSWGTALIFLPKRWQDWFMEGIA